MIAGKKSPGCSGSKYDSDMCWEDRRPLGGNSSVEMGVISGFWDQIWNIRRIANRNDAASFEKSHVQAKNKCSMFCV